MYKFIAWIVFFLLLQQFSSCNHSYSADGIVQRTEQGRDRYMLFMKDDQNKLYRVIVSRPDMGSNYLDVNLGDRVRIYGDTVHWQDEIHLRARSIQVLEK